MTRDLLYQDRVRDVVRRAYGELPTGAGAAIAERLYGPDELGQLPTTAIDWALGVGNPAGEAGLTAGETVLDLGCGGGIDMILAAEAVGPTGRVIGVDMLPEMCARAAAAAAQAGVAGRCEPLVAEMEALPLPAASVDVVISNGAVNLSPRKSRLLAEAARVLRPGGRLCIADLVVETELPPEILGAEASWAGCIAGALAEEVLVAKLSRVGFMGIEVGRRRAVGLDELALYPLLDPPVVEQIRSLLPADRCARIAESVVVRATAPTPRGGSDATGAAAERTGTRRRAVADGPALTDADAIVRRIDELDATTDAVPGVAIRQLKQVDDIDLKVLDVTPGGATPHHAHLHAHEGVIVAGRGHLRLGETRLPLRPGDVFSVDPMREHAIVCDGEQPLRLVCLDCLV